MTFADKGYQGAGGSIRTPFKRHRPATALVPPGKAVNRSHAKIRAVGERAIATVKCWKLLTKLHCCPERAQVENSSRNPGFIDFSTAIITCCRSSPRRPMHYEIKLTTGTPPAPVVQPGRH